MQDHIRASTQHFSVTNHSAPRPENPCGSLGARFFNGARLQVRRTNGLLSRPHFVFFAPPPPSCRR
jgi:hypothetical protein